MCSNRCLPLSVSGIDLDSVVSNYVALCFEIGCDIQPLRVYLTQDPNDAWKVINIIYDLPATGVFLRDPLANVDRYVDQLLLPPPTMSPRIVPAMSIFVLLVVNSSSIVVGHLDVRKLTFYGDTVPLNICCNYGSQIACIVGISVDYEAFLSGSEKIRVIEKILAAADAFMRQLSYNIPN